MNDVQLNVLLITSQKYDVNVTVSAYKTSDSSVYCDCRNYQRNTNSIFNNTDEFNTISVQTLGSAPGVTEVTLNRLYTVILKKKILSNSDNITFSYFYFYFLQKCGELRTILGNVKHRRKEVTYVDFFLLSKATLFSRS